MLYLPFTIYDALGNVLRTGECQATNFALQPQEGEFVVEGKADDVTQWVNPQTGEIEGRQLMEPEFVIANPLVTVNNLPPNTRITVNDLDTFDVEGSSIEFQFDSPGLYVLYIQAPGYYPIKNTDVDF